MKDPLKPRDKITQKMTRDGAIAENQTTGDTERISNRIRDADLQKTPEQQAAQDAMQLPPVSDTSPLPHVPGAAPKADTGKTERVMKHIDAAHTRKASKKAVRKAQAEAQKADALEQARRQGQQEAKAEAERAEAQRAAEYQKKAAGLDAEYQKRMDELEPQFVDTITGIYEHIFDVDLHSYREVLCYLISATMRKTEDNRSFLVHVSKEDYPYVSMQKKQIMAGATAPNSTVEIVEDMTLGKGECMIETESGIFDCGLGTQLSELRQKLKLLSYEG